MLVFEQGYLSRKNLSYFSIYTAEENLSRKTCQGKLASVNGALLVCDTSVVFLLKLTLEHTMIVCNPLVVTLLYQTQETLVSGFGSDSRYQ